MLQDHKMYQHWNDVCHTCCAVGQQQQTAQPPPVIKKQPNKKKDAKKKVKHVYAQVIKGLCPGERAYVKARQPHVSVLCVFWYSPYLLRVNNRQFTRYWTLLCNSGAIVILVLWLFVCVQVKKALEKMLDMKLSDNEVPNIAFSFSGGGVRAMIAAIGFTQGAQELGLYDACTYR